MTYHLKHIEKGTLGEWSKVVEELEEFEDAIQQDAQLMALVELADLYGALDCFLSNKLNTTVQSVHQALKEAEPYNLLAMGLSFPTANELIKYVSNVNPDNIENLVISSGMVAGFMDCYAHNFNMDLNDLAKMSMITARAFKSGRRT